MSARFTIPTIFTAVDKFSAPVKKMGASISKFAQKAERGVARGERAFRKLTPSLGSATKQFLSFASAAAIGGAIIGGIGFSVKALVEYEDALASTQAITGKSNEEFIAYEKQIQSIAKTSKKSTIEIAKGFEVVGSLAPQLLANADALGAVTDATITLSKASGDDLATSASSMIGVMNQFSLTGGPDAIRTMNALAAGSVAGSSNITQIGDSMKNFGSVAAGANLTLEQSVALVEVMGKFSLFGAEAGTKLRGSVLKLQKAGLGYTSGQFSMNDALAEAKAKFDLLATAKEQDAFLNKTFGAENVSTGKILMNNTDLFEQYTKAVTGTNTATEQAEIKSNTLSNRMAELKAGWVNMITGSDGAKGALDGVKKAIVFLTDNMETIVSVGSKVIGVILAAKAALMIARGAIMAYNVATKVITASQWLWNAAMMANPIGLIIAAVAALAIGVYALSKAFDTSTRSERLNGEVRKRALDATIDQRVEVTMLFSALRKAEVGSDNYNKTLERLEQIQPGIIKQYNLQAGALDDINRAEKDLTASILKRAEAEARAELIKEKFKEAQQIRDEGPGFFEKVAAFNSQLNSSIGIGQSFTADQLSEAQARNLETDAAVLADQQAAAQLNPQQSSNENISKNITENNQSLTIDFKNMPEGVTAEGSDGTNFSTPALGTTN